MIALDIGSMTYDLPESWTEVVAAGKYLDVVRVNYTHSVGEEAIAKMKVIEVLTGLNGYELGRAGNAGNAKQRIDLALKLDDFIAEQIVYEVFPLLDFIFEPELLTVNPLPVIKYNGVSYYGPGEKMMEQTGAEMEECGFAHSEFVKTGDEAYLDLLVAAMYRPKRFVFGQKLPYSPELAARQAKVFKGLDPILKRGVLLFYEMCEEWWRRTYESLYEQYGNDGTQDAPEIDSLANSRILRALAGEKRGLVNDVRQMPRQEIYFELAELERERRELEKKK